MRILIDQGSEISLITESLVNKLHLKRKASNINIVGIGESSPGSTKGSTSVIIQSDLPYNQQIEVNAHILKKLTAKIPPITFKVPVISQLNELQLADKYFWVSAPVDIIIGADYYGKVIKEQLIKFSEIKLIAQSTIFGWVLSGPLSYHDCYPKSSLSVVKQSPNQQLLELLKKFWTQEELPESSTSQLSPEEQECETHFQQTHTRDSSGRYCVRLPIKTSPEALGESRSKALKLLQRTKRKSSTDPTFNQLYNDFLKEYQDLNHMRRAPLSPEPSNVFYFPHLGVLREDSLTTRLRVVFNGSSKTSSGLSINDILHPGPKLQTNIFDVLLRFRKHRLVFGTDITKMFRQINIHPDDWDLQRILWFDEEGNIIPYQLTTVTYGTTSAPWLSLRTLEQLVHDEGHRFPKAVSALREGKYVDDIYDGADDEDELAEIIQQLINLCKAGGFPLQKWSTNCPQVLERLEITPSSSSPTKIMSDKSSTKVLGVQWNQQSDSLQFITSKAPVSSKITKRVILSEIAQLYDPLGLSVPVVIRAKIFIQQLWKLQLNWDDRLPDEYINTWTQYREELEQLNQIQIPRWLQFTSDPSSEIQIHGFSDASNHAMSAVVYLRVSSPTSTPVITFVAAKTKVAPLKRMTIPRLELAAAVLLSELVASIQKTLDLEHAKTYLWSDSSVALTWIKGHPSRWKEFVQNRVQKIIDNKRAAEWRHISGSYNPADCASRGLSPEQLASHPLWWTGPPWLTSSPDEWPISPVELSNSEAASEERPTLVTSMPVQVEEENELLSRYSSLSKLLRISAISRRICDGFMGRPVPESPGITPKEIDNARTYWLKHTQQIFFAEELRIIGEGNHLNKGHPLAKLMPFIDEKGVLRVGGRLNNAPINPNEQHQAIIPRQSKFTTLVLNEAHQQTLHGGTQLTLAYIRQRFWILGGRAPVRSYIIKCVRCARHRAQRARQLMGQLPAERVTPKRAFFHTGVDFAGPYTTLRWRGSGAVTYKSYIAVFVCFATSAVHLELVTDLSSDGFIAAYKRFVARRGIPKTITSDHGLNFTGAARELKELFTQTTQQYQTLAADLATRGTEWKFIPPKAPHFGGKWEAAVKSVKHHLRRIMGKSTLTYEEFTTLLCQVETILNSRPLCPLTDDPEDVSALTPGHFLIGESTTAVPEPNILDLNVHRLNRWQLINQKTQDFWDRWHRECLQRYQAINKWMNPQNDIEIGSIVLILEENYPPAKWAMGRVIDCYPGKDGHIRVVKLKTSAHPEVIRPIHRLVPLPVRAEDDLRVPEIIQLDGQQPGPSSDQPRTSSTRRLSSEGETSDTPSNYPSKRRRLN